MSNYTPTTNLIFTQDSQLTTDVVFGGEYLNVVFVLTGQATAQPTNLTSAGTLSFTPVSTITGSCSYIPDATTTGNLLGTRVFRITGSFNYAAPTATATGQLVKVYQLSGSPSCSLPGVTSLGLLDTTALRVPTTDIVFEYPSVSSSEVVFSLPREGIQLITGQGSTTRPDGITGDGRLRFIIPLLGSFTTSTIQQFIASASGILTPVITIVGNFATNLTTTGSGVVYYDPNVPRGPGLNAGAKYLKPKYSPTMTNMPSARSVARATNAALLHGKGTDITLDKTTIFTQGRALASTLGLVTGTTTAVKAVFRAIYAHARPLARLYGTPWIGGHYLALDGASMIKPVINRPRDINIYYGLNKALVTDLTNPTGKVYEKHSEVTLVWSRGIQRAGRSRFVVVVPVSPGNYGTSDIIFSCEQQDSNITFGISPCKRFKARRSYYLKHNIEIMVVGENVALPVTGGIAMGITADDYAWNFSANLAGKDAWEMLDITAAPVYISVKLATNNLETAEWHFVIEDVSHGESFGKRSLSTKGRSRTVLLSERYIPPVNYTAPAASANQLADLVLPFGGGWTAIWNYEQTWPLPQNAFNYQNQAPIGAIAQIVNGVGGMIIPDKKDKKLTIAPRYKYMPWDYANIVDAINIPQEAIISIDYRLTPLPQANGVYVRGPDNGGVLAWVKRDGTDGATLASDFQSQLICHEYGARYAGERILADKYTPPAIKSFTIPLGGVDFPLINVGDLVDVGNQHVRGTVMGVSINASDKGVRQTISLGNDSNSWVQFQKLLPRYPLVVGEVIGVLDNSNLLVGFSSGSAIVRGSEALGAKVYVRNGKTEGIAPGLTSMEIII